MRDRYLNLKETNDYDRIVKEYNNHYGYDINMVEHRSGSIDNENISHLNAVNDDILLKKR